MKIGNSANILIIVLVILTFASNIQAKTRISYSRPTIYVFSGLENDFYTPKSPYTATPYGNILHFEYEDFPMLGVESYTVQINEADANKIKSFVEYRFIDVMYNTDFKNLNLYGGIGIGDVKFNCRVSACEDYTFTGSSAAQFFIQIGIPVIQSIDIHISVHRVIGQNEVKIGNETTLMDLGGSLAAWGLLIRW